MHDDVKKLRAFGRSIGVSIRMLSKATMDRRFPSALAVYSHDDRLMYVTKEIEDDHVELVHAMAHELGHALDFLEDERRWPICSIAMTHCLLNWSRGKPPNRTIGRYLFERELAAQENAHAIMRDVGIKIADSAAMRRTRVLYEAVLQIHYLDVDAYLAGETP